jgi:hypothetical protein
MIKDEEVDVEIESKWVWAVLLQVSPMNGMDEDFCR